MTITVSWWGLMLVLMVVYTVIMVLVVIPLVRWAFDMAFLRYLRWRKEDPVLIAHIREHEMGR